VSEKRLRQLRQLVFEKQNHRCFYCKYPIWHTAVEEFSRAFGVTRRLSKHLKCTAEHLVARQDNGQDTADNIVAACLWCNRMRHYRRQHRAPDAATYKLRVAQLIALGRWHPLAQANERSKVPAARLPFPALAIALDNVGRR
jgi:5-methylcytosine-specific restriction endonuclease McrA